MSEKEKRINRFILLNEDEHNNNEIKKNILSLESYTLSWLQYYSMYCVKYQKGYIDVAKKILSILNKIFLEL